MNSSMLAAFVILCFSGCISGESGSHHALRTLNGRAYFSGGEPNLQLMVDDGDGIYCIGGLSLEEQAGIQDRQVRLEGSFADGFCRDGSGRVFKVSNYTLIQ